MQRPARGVCLIVRASAVKTKTLKIGTRGSPLALAQAYLTRQLLQVRLDLVRAQDQISECLSAAATSTSATTDSVAVAAAAVSTAVRCSAVTLS